MGRTKNVLVVEDNLINQRAAQSMLNDFNCHVSIVGNGKLALEKYQNNFDVILMDIGLPDMSGIDVIKKIREQEIQTLNVSPAFIIVLTAHGNDIKKECLDAGANEFEIKPFNKEIFKRIFDHLISK
jgi:CheY-like chemotaxis protein